MRETVENQAGGLCLFLQGASGDLAPREQHTSSIESAEQQGRELGFSVLATLAGMLRPGVQLQFGGVVESGAPLGVWRRATFAAERSLDVLTDTIRLDRGALPSLEALRQRWLPIGERVADERVERAAAQRRALGEGQTIELPYWIWRIGDAMLIGQPGEAYSWLQQELRRRLPLRAVAVVNLVNGVSLGYLPPAGLYDRDLYQVWQSPFGAGSLEALAGEVTARARQVLPDRSSLTP
jgi:hypothetical protein